MRMEEFTMRNFLKQWKAILPLAIILTFAGLIAGVAYAATRTQSYSATNEVLVINSMESALPDDYVAIANSKPAVGDKAKEDAGADKACFHKATRAGNVVKITATCGSSKEDAVKLADNAATQFAVAVHDYYEQGNVQVKNISRTESQELVPSSNKIVYTVVAGLAGLAASAFIAFVKLDHLSSKKRK